MSPQPKRSGADEASGAGQETAEQRVPRFTVGELRERPELLGLTAADLALTFHDADPEDSHTEAEVLKAVEKARGGEPKNEIDVEGEG